VTDRPARPAHETSTPLKIVRNLTSWERRYRIVNRQPRRLPPKRTQVHEARHGAVVGISSAGLLGNLVGAVGKLGGHISDLLDKVTTKSPGSDRPHEAERGLLPEVADLE
jgi:hypothetical protein